MQLRETDRQARALIVQSIPETYASDERSETVNIFDR